ncbi:hypothetical protein FAZ19_22270 [Sphingobacterium alkalisoli]|uniref:Uncharacterized protein n=1 Tax=Sphingobacterium alkalisoli TaxID=1874115 RepID=A0A4U0GR88_9SPHI|nr:hypothetical protein [Sphingobacterium alkalisoli]TJY61347.1 hypothetical protein FAZ19_22270 [Sphingobacterium alkalisoli]
MYNKGIPFYYLTAPCSYYYTLLLLYPGARISRYWYLHLIPFVFGLIDIIPYTLASAQEKAQLLALVVSDIKMGFRHSYGYIEQKWHYILRFGLSAVYLVAQWRLLYIYDPRENSRFQVRWPLAISFAVIYSLQILLQGTLVMTVLSNELQGTFLLRDINQVIWISLFFLLLTLWFCWSAWRRVRLK